MELQTKIRRINDILKDKRVIIAFSGGSDSTLLAKIASKVSKEAMAVTIDTGTLPEDFIENVKGIASKLRISHRIIKENLLEDENFRKNPYHKCFICKDRMYSLLESIAEKEGFDIIVDGTNITDILEDRPGMIANYKRKIRSPLLEAKVTEDDVREYLKRENIIYYPNTTCLATRIKGPITIEKINRISYAENLIKDLTGLQIVRVRDFDGTAVIQTDDISKILDMKLLEYIKDKFKLAGFKRVHIDIGGYHKKRGELIKSKKGDETIYKLKLPYPIDIEKTCANLNIRCSLDTIKVRIGDGIVKISEDGNVTIEKIHDRKEVERILLAILVSIRRLGNYSTV